MGGFFSYADNMAAIQKVLDIRGAAKVWKFCCHRCSLVSSHIVTHNTGENICGKWQHEQRSRPHWQCYYHPMSSNDQTEKYQAVLKELMGSWNHDRGMV